MKVTARQLRKIIHEAVGGTSMRDSAEQLVASLDDDGRQRLADAVMACWGSQLEDLQRLLPDEMSGIISSFDEMCAEINDALERHPPTPGYLGYEKD